MGLSDALPLEQSSGAKSETERTVIASGLSEVDEILADGLFNCDVCNRLLQLEQDAVGQDFVCFGFQSGEGAACQ